MDVDYFHYDGASNKLPSLASATEGKYLAGVALSVRDINSEVARKLAADNFNCIVAENCMKSAEIHPEEDVYDFTDADKFVEFGVKNNMKIIGHCLIWHSQCPHWFCHDEKGNLVSPEVLKRRMKEHITTVMQRYRGKIHGWDVVNEAIENDGSWRNSDFYKILGAEFIPLAFRYAHEADPDAQLYYNDYSMDAEGKRNTVVNLIRDLKKRGLRIDAVGMQSHVGLHEPTIDEYEKSLLAFVAEGVHVMATEFDVSILPFVHASANISDTAKYDERLNPYRNGVPEEVQFEWNKRVRDFFNLYDKYSDVFDRLTVWGLTDASSWKNNFPIVGRTDYPVFIDRAGKIKPVVYDIIGDYIRNKK
ncbi:endo-1,4-beta-xylanase [Duncaniella freteri]|uniref:endo-1,4-beta-xylanase n=1 Tax=Duncaniella freteri TaxID=2530391 RepID=UPI003F66D4E8